MDELFVQFGEQGVKRIIFYGASELAEIAYISLQGFSIDLVAIIDEAKVGESFLGYVISDFSKAKIVEFDKCLITASDYSVEVCEHLTSKGFHLAKITLLQ